MWRITAPQSKMGKKSKNVKDYQDLSVCSTGIDSVGIVFCQFSHRLRCSVTSSFFFLSQVYFQDSCIQSAWSFSFFFFFPPPPNFSITCWYSARILFFLPSSHTDTSSAVHSVILWIIRYHHQVVAWRAHTLFYLFTTFFPFFFFKQRRFVK